MGNTLENIRKEFTQKPLNVNDLHVNPFAQFSKWMDEALISDVTEPNAMTLATADKYGKPSARMVLLKHHGESGFTFFTNYQSRKSLELLENPYAALLIYWPELERQIRLEGQVEKTTPEISDEYFEKRPEGSRIGAWASPQSQPIPNRTYLENLEKDYQKIFEKKPLKRPSHWGGFKLIPHRFEFWQGRKNRLHDRIEYYLDNQFWKIHRLAP